MEFIEDRIAPTMDAKIDYEEWQQDGLKKAEELLNETKGDKKRE